MLLSREPLTVSQATCRFKKEDEMQCADKWGSVFFCFPRKKKKEAQGALFCTDSSPTPVPEGRDLECRLLGFKCLEIRPPSPPWPGEFRLVCLQAPPDPKALPTPKRE
ncbi:hypothetical protein LY76DRAFT_219997 [Colletotrichum caudatum]|nr:hypothetical protein LY76DRAFT_219997 [Colletotrichum caudatum]